MSVFSDNLSNGNAAFVGLRRITSGMELRGSLLLADRARSPELSVCAILLVVGKLEVAPSTMHSRTVIKHCEMPWKVCDDRIRRKYINIHVRLHAHEEYWKNAKHHVADSEAGLQVRFSHRVEQVY